MKRDASHACWAVTLAAATSARSDEELAETAAGMSHASTVGVLFRVSEVSTTFKTKILERLYKTWKWLFRTSVARDSARLTSATTPWPVSTDGKFSQVREDSQHDSHLHRNTPNPPKSPPPPAAAS